MPYIIDPKTKQRLEIDPMTGRPINPVAPTPQPTPSMGQSGNMDQTTGKKQPNLLDRIARALVKPAVDYGNLVGGAGYEVFRKGKEILGDKKAYGYRDESTGEWVDVKNPFLTEKELETFSDPKKGLLEGAKRSAGMASYFVPGGKLAEGAGVGAKILQGVKVGAEVGGLQGFSQSEGENLEDLATDTVKGGIVGGATGGVVGGVGGVVSKMKGAKGATQAKIINPDVPASPTMVGKKAEIVQELSNMGVKGSTAEEIATNVGKKYKELGSQAEQILANSTKSKSLGRLQTVIKKQLNENGEYFIPDDPRYEKLLERELTLLSKKAENGKLSAKALYDFKNELAGKLNNGFRKEAGDLSSPISDIEGVRLDLWRHIDDQITGIEPEVKTITKQMSILHKASPGLKKSMEQLKEARPLGIPTGLNLNKPLQSAQSKAAGVMSMAGKAGEIASNPNMVKAGVIAGSNIPQDGSQPSGATPLYEPGGNLTPPSPQTETQGALTVVEQSPDGQWQTMSDGKSYSMDGKWVFDEQMDDWVPNETPMGGEATATNDKNPDAPMSRAEYNTALATLAQRNDTASVRQYGLIQKERDYYYPETKLSANAQKRIGILNQAEGIYSMVQNLALGSGTGVGAWFKSKVGKLPGVEGGSEEDLNRVNLALAKGLAGALASEVGVATDRDIERWLGLMPRVEDTMAERKRALARLAAEIMRSRQQIEAQTENPSSTAVGTDMSSGDDISSYFFPQQ